MHKKNAQYSGCMELVLVLMGLPRTKLMVVYDLINMTYRMSDNVLGFSSACITGSVLYSVGENFFFSSSNFFFPAGVRCILVQVLKWFNIEKK